MPRGDASELAASSLFTDILKAEQDEEDLLIKNKNHVVCKPFGITRIYIMVNITTHPNSASNRWRIGNLNVSKF